MSRLLAAITLPLSIALTILVTIICSVPIIVAGLIKLLVPIPAVWRSISVFCNFMMYCWCEGLALLLHLNPWLKWDVQGLEGLQRECKRQSLLLHRLQLGAGEQNPQLRSQRFN